MGTILNRKVFSEEETIILASEFSKNLKTGEIIVLNGNLGAGKTFFVKNTLKNLGLDNTSSPTFAIVNEYTGKLKVYHFDFFRIKDSAELFDIGFFDYLNDNEAVIFIEWGNLFKDVLPQKRLEVEILIEGDFEREFIFKRYE